MGSMLLPNSLVNKFLLLFVKLETEVVKGLDDRYYEVKIKKLGETIYLIDYVGYKS